jgi:hypothetical protein
MHMMHGGSGISVHQRMSQQNAGDVIDFVRFCDKLDLVSARLCAGDAPDAFAMYQPCGAQPAGAARDDHCASIEALHDFVLFITITPHTHVRPLVELSPTDGDAFSRGGPCCL